MNPIRSQTFARPNVTSIRMRMGTLLLVDVIAEPPTLLIPYRARQPVATLYSTVGELKTLGRLMESWKTFQD